MASMENPIIKCNIKGNLRYLPLAGLSLSISIIIDIGLELAIDPLPITLYTLTLKIALNVPDNVSAMTCSYIFACCHRFMNFL